MITAVLGPLLLLTDRTQCLRPLPDVVAAAVEGGARTVVLREKDLPDDERARLADTLRPLLQGGTLVMAGTGLGASGLTTAGRTEHAVHLSAADAVPVPRPALLGRSCHGPAAVSAAAGCDWVTVSPVRTTASKPGYGPALGIPGLSACVHAAGAPPVYALGGIGPDDVPACRQAGAAGIAVMGGVMRSPHPDRAVAALLAHLEDA